MDAKQDKQPERKQERATPQKFGMTSSEFYAGLQGKAVQIVTIDAKVYGGVLIGLDQYDIFIKTPAGAVVLIAKHAIKTAQAATNGTPAS